VTSNPELDLLGHQMQLAAWVMLFIYACLVMLILPREIRFLREAEPPFRRRFLLLDVLLQVFILLILVPCAIVTRLSPELMTLVLIGFSGLWVVVAFLSYLRYVYTYRILMTATMDQLRRTEEALQKRAQGKDSPP
jgi:hypothetical protein